MRLSAICFGEQAESRIAASRQARRSVIAPQRTPARWRTACSTNRGGHMKKIEDDGTRPLPETAELGGEGGSFGDGASRESRRHPGNPMPPVEGAVTDV